jgi:hypothetical protein
MKTLNEQKQNVLEKENHKIKESKNSSCCGSTCCGESTDKKKKNGEEN